MSDFNLTYTQIGDLGNKIGGDAGAKGILSGERVVVSRTDPRAAALILQFERKIRVVAGQFVAGKNFTKGNPKVKFGYIDERVGKFFSAEENVPVGELAVHTLLQDTCDPEIMVALGLQSRRFVKMGHFYQVIEVQGQGQADGPLLVNGRANIAYILDDRGAPWAVSARWIPGCDGWYVFVSSVASLGRWFADLQVFS